MDETSRPRAENTIFSVRAIPDDLTRETTLPRSRPRRRGFRVFFFTSLQNATVINARPRVHAGRNRVRVYTRLETVATLDAV